MSENEDLLKGFEEWRKTNRSRADFFQASRLLFSLAAQTRSQEDARRSLSLDSHPDEEVVRFRAEPSLGHPAREVAVEKATTSHEHLITDMVVSFLGLTGPSGVLPRHYTEKVCERIRQNDLAMRDFFDLFNHRLLSLFFHAWKKYRLPFSFEYALLEGRAQDDPISRSLYSLVGMGTAGLKDRAGFSDATYVYFGGAFANQIPEAVSLERMINDQFQVSAEVQQWQPDVLVIEERDRTRVGLNSALGSDAVLGERVTTFESRFRVRLGPVELEQFNKLTPAGEDLQVLGQFIRSYVGLAFDFDVQLVLRRSAIPQTQLGGELGGSRLGWNSWLTSEPPSTDADDAFFACDSIPSI